MKTQQWYKVRVAIVNEATNVYGECYRFVKASNADEAMSIAESRVYRSGGLACTWNVCAMDTTSPTQTDWSSRYDLGIIQWER